LFYYFLFYFFFFFFSSRRRHTRFDCDWSSDVCSSDLLRREPERLRTEPDIGEAVADVADACLARDLGLELASHDRAELEREIARSEERRVGKECRAGWSADQ